MKYGTGSILLLFSILSVTGDLFSQNCDTRYISLTYRGTTFEKFSHAAFTPGNELVSSGYLVDYNGAGHISKLNKNGNPLWSKYYSIGYFTFYNPTFFSNVRINDFVFTGDGGLVAAGQVERYYDNRTRVYVNQLALLAKIDKYGNVEWSKTYLAANMIGDLSFTKICKTSDGDYIVYMANDKGPSLDFNAHSFNRIIRFSPGGQLKWATTLYSGDYDAGGRGLLFKRGLIQLGNKNIVAADVVYKSQRGGNVFKMFDGRLHFYCLDYNTGKINWESNYPYALPAADSFFVPDIHHVAEMGDGRLSFSTSLYISSPMQPSLTKKPVTIITNSNGVAQNIISYSSATGMNYELAGIEPSVLSGNMEMLLRDGNLSIVASVSNEGVINGTKGYDGAFPSNCLASGNRGYGIWMSNYNSLEVKLIFTDANGNAGCAEVPAEMLAQTLPPANDNPAAVVTVPIISSPTNYKDYFADYGYPLKIKDEYPLLKTTDCEQQVECCHDIVDTLNIKEVTICENTSYKLPDNNIVKDSGMYYVTLTTSSGCDSITYYNVHIDKSLSYLTLGNDTCLTRPGPVELKATEGYGAYNWMGNFSGSSYTVHTDGIYWVKVTNACGTRTDSIHIYEQCDFPIYMPSAFTPNGDNLNDYFGVPEQNKNRLIELKVFNRWGEIVFETGYKGGKWDGKFKNTTLDTGVFVYFLVMEGLSGNRITQKGMVTLIR